MLAEGVLTKDPIRKYPLSLANLQVILKIYAVNNRQPFTYSISKTKGQFTEYYLTDEGLEYFYEFFNSHSLAYCRSTFSNFFTQYKEDVMPDPRTYHMFNNFRGVSGKKQEAGTKQRALIVRKVKRCERKYEFDSIKQARQQLNLWLTLYPIEEFTLYRVREQKGYTVREKIPLIVTPVTDHYKAGQTDWRK